MRESDRRPDQPHSRFGTRLRALREAAGFTQETLAERAGLSLNAIGALERGDRQHPYPSTIHALAGALGLSEEARAELAATAPRRLGRGARPDPRTAPRLPSPPTPLLGREREVAEVVARLSDPDTRVLTLTGPGGVGKTRLALRIAEEAREIFTDGAWWVPLGVLSDDHLVVPTILRALGLPDAGEADPLDSLVTSLRDREALLVLDNFEQVAAAAPAVAAVVRECPRVRVLVTSRLPLRIDAEQEFPVLPLALPANAAALPLDALAQVPAVALFLQRARAVRPDVSLENGNAAAIVEICATLDGLPLAIELAAAHAKLLSPDAMLRMLANRLRLLSGGGVDRPPRLRSMRDAIAWSYHLLDPQEQALFRRLAVFAGGVSLEAIAGVAGGDQDPAELLDTLERLVDHSLLVREAATSGDVRLRMYQTIREFGLERLAEQGELEATRDAHAAWFLALVTTAREQIEGEDRREAHARVQRELDNLRGALTWLHATGNAADARRLTNELARFWVDFGHVREGREWLERVVAMPEDVPPMVAIEALYWAAGFANLRGDSARAGELATRGLALAQASDEPLGAAMTLTQLGESIIATDPDAARAHIEEALAIFHARDEPVREAMALRQLGKIAHRQGQHREALRHYELALAIWRRLRHPWGMPAGLRDQAAEELAQGDPATAWTLYQESLVHWRELGEPLHMSDTLGGLAGAALALGHPERAAFLLGAQDALDSETGYVPSAAGVATRVEAVRAALGPATFDAAWERGRSLSREEMVTAVLALPVPTP